MTKAGLHSFTSLVVGSFLFLCLNLAGCGGGGGTPAPTVATGSLSPVTPTNVVGPIVVPPDPGPSASATVAGIDSNGNGVRDEVERALAITANGSLSDFQAILKPAAAAQVWLTKPTVTEAEALNLVMDEFKQARCLRSAIADPIKSRLAAEAVQNQTFNTPERRKVRLTIRNQVGTIEVPLNGAISC